MKRVIAKEDNSVVSVDNVSPQKFYGVKNHSGEKGFVYKAKFLDNYSFRIIFDVNVGNHSIIGPQDLNGIVKNFLTPSNSVFEFDTQEELFDWLSA